MSDWKYATVVPTETWRSANTIPRELALKKVNDRYSLLSKPVMEFADLRIPADTLSIKNLSFTGEKEISTGKVSLMQSELFIGFDLSDSRCDSLGIIMENDVNERFVIGYSVLKKQFYIDRTKAGNPDFSKEFSGVSTAPYSVGAVLKLHLLVDASSVELFVDDGSLVMTTLVFPTEKFTRLKLFSKGGSGILNKAVFHGIRKVWH
jgi:fructan beta-fructosidase